MSIKLGIYDFFAYMVPGGIIVVAFIYVLATHFGFIVEYEKLSAAYLVVFGILAYLTGYVVDFVSGKTWIRLFSPKDLFEKTIDDFDKRNARIKISIKEVDWYVVLAFVRKQNSDIADTIDKLNAQSMMLKNSSLGTLLFCIIFIVEFFVLGYSINYLILSVMCLIISMIFARQSVKFLTWYYLGIYQSYVGLIADPSFLPVKLINESPKKK